MVITYTKLRSNLKSVLDKVCSDSEPVLIERQNGEDVVMLSREDYASLVETAYLMRSPANAKRLHKAMNQERVEQVTFKDTDELRHALGL